ncbi:MAG TPA: hypothetical protein VFU22_16755 [Roseiflexaceae bacterium]|nr:hypothetical protein [Roseiflexaceae bacterium]
MNTSTIARNIGAQWLRSSIAIVAVLLISGTFVFGLANRATINVAPAASVSAARERIVAFKDAQAEARDTTIVPAPAPAAWLQHYTALKDTQAELRDATVVPAPVQPSGRERLWEFKQHQAELRDAGGR